MKTHSCFATLHSKVAARPAASVVGALRREPPVQVTAVMVCVVTARNCWPSFEGFGGKVMVRAAMVPAGTMRASMQNSVGVMVAPVAGVKTSRRVFPGSAELNVIATMSS
ncbi:hypothetical protein RSEGYP2_45 [Ralstonia phage RsoP1EGY]|uniref:Uncharacterized protein n=1 Tax=Ralstonia phage RsoP1EGY TaxID=2070026 RepID=A0A2R2ZGF1_9CAUD|nr:hypothetical protein HOT00_gp45 [Ralstonia phage RsoP1EGY]AUO78203.1 hypothetical protein RSEGYP2_45 [Ralstonia phage RsoP1EGY]